MKIQFDRLLQVAYGSSRKIKVWKNKPTRWSELLDRLSRTTRTAETAAEYKAMGRDRQSEIKDVGGFVGGYCKNGSRTAVSSRSILCLDADFADGDIWPDWVELFGCAAALYSTHKHTPAKQRLRLVVPLSRDVTPEEYPAVGRKVAAALGIDKFDDSTYTPARMMYWPSTSRDGEFVFEFLDAPLLNPDGILATYADWRDVSSWPTSSRVADIAQRRAEHQADPTAKGGLVGAFCRAYTIQEAIEAFIPAYAPCAEPGRYTYTAGSTAAGVVIYADKYAYSHHATDPASMQLCNAWDLVRLHRFGDLDAGCDPDAKSSSRPSYKAMAQMAMEDDRVRIQLANDRLSAAQADFGDTLPEEAENADAWKAKLRLTEKGALQQSIENVVVLLENDPRLKGSIALNEMDHNIVLRRSVPWRSIGTPGQWMDVDDAALRYYLEKCYGISSKDKIFDAVNVAAMRHSFHPVREYLEGCVWDGVPRAETLLIDYLGAEDSVYTRAVTRKTLAAAVARIYRPGCKFDYMLTIRGRQGLGKSALISRLGGEWFSDTFSTMQGKEAYEQVMGVWIMEVGELAGMRKAETETIKLYISKQSDRFRPAYGRRLQEFPRQCIFIGTTNESQFLRDTTGNRRFWVVDTPDAPQHNIWQELTPDVVRLIWAEAVKIFRAGEPLYLSPELETVARSVQEEYEEENPRAGVVAAYLDRLLPEGWDDMDLYARRQWLESPAAGTIRRDSVCVMEIWAEALSGNPDRFDRYAGAEIRSMMDKLPGWRRAKGRIKTVPVYGRQRYYERIPSC